MAIDINEKDSGFAASGSEIGSTKSADNLSAGGDIAADSAIRMADQVAEKARATIDSVTDAAHRFTDDADQAVTSVVRGAREQGERLRANKQKVVSTTVDFVKTHPLKAIGIAVTAGIVIGRVIRK